MRRGLPTILKATFKRTIVTAIVVFAATLNQVYAATYYSRVTTGNWNAVASWSQSSHTGGPSTTLPGANDDVVIGGGDAITFNLASVTVASLTVGNAGTGNLTFSNTVSSTGLTVIGDVTINTNGTITCGASTARTHIFTIGGNVINNGTLNLAVGNLATVVFNGADHRTISGTGTTTLLNLSLQTTASRNVNVETNIRFNGTMNFVNDGLLVVNASSAITMGPTAAFTNSDDNAYVQLDGTSGAASQLLSVYNNNVSNWRKIYPVGTAINGYSPVDLRTATLAGATAATNATLAVKVIVSTSIQGQLRRMFRLVVAGNGNATTLSNAIFNYKDPGDVSFGDNIANYNTIWFLNASAGSSGAWSTTVGGSTAGPAFFTAPAVAQPITNGTYYYTIGTGTAYPNTWYSYQTGNWSGYQNWTLDPSGTTLLNPLGTPPASGDEVVIANGVTITADAAAGNLVVSNTTIQGGGTLDMSTTTGQNLGNVSGAGLLRIGGVVASVMALPTGTYTNFVTPGTGGTIEYYNAAGTNYLPAQAAYNHLLLTNTAGAAATYISTNNLAVSGNLTISGGASTATWQINDATATQRTLTLNGDLTVAANGQIRVGTGKPANAHALTIYGNITNNGSIKFFDTSDVQLEEADYPPASRGVFINALKGNAVNVNFMGVANQLVTCNNTTDFYRLIVNKGNGQQALLTVTSTDENNFRLFGPTNINAGFTANDPQATTRVSLNSLSLQNGTLKLEGKIYIRSLVESGTTYNGWPIPQTAALWLNSPDVTIDVNNLAANADWRYMYLYGLLRITDGTINMGYSRGLLGGGAGVFRMEGGTLNTWQIRTTIVGSDNTFSYVQTGGNVNVATTITSGVAQNDFSRFCLGYSTCSFSMSGGTLSVGYPYTGGATTNGGILIGADAANVNVTGGTVRAVLPTTGVDFTITSTAPFYNLEISKLGTGTSKVALNATGFEGGTVPAQPLIILNDLKLTTGGTNPTLAANANNITIGGNFEIQANTTFTPGANTLTFNGTGLQTWTNNGTITSLSNVTVNKATGSVLTLAGGAFPSIAGTATGLTLTSGILNDNGKTVTVTGAITNNAFHTGTGSITLTGPLTIGGDKGSFGNLIITTANSTTVTSGDQSITGNLRLAGTTRTVLNIGSHNLSVMGDISTSGTFGANYSILTNGLRNDGGLTRQATDEVDLLFPLSSSITDTPVTINTNVDNATGVAGKITVRPVATTHPNVTVTNRSVAYYWRVTQTGFASVSAVTHKTYKYNTAARPGVTTNNYRPARFDPTTLSWSYGATYNATVVPGSTTIPDFATPGLPTIIEGEYTAGDAAAFDIVRAYYSNNIAGDWNTPAHWANDAARTIVSTTVPCATCPVIISNGHTMNVSANNTSSGSLQIATGATLDCKQYTGLNFGANTGEVVSGTGAMRINIAAGAFPAGDFSTFLDANGGTVEWYGLNTAAATIPATSTAPRNYYHLIVNPFAGQTITLPAISFPVYGTFTKTGTGTVITSGTQTITVTGDFNVNQGTFTLPVASTTTLNLNGTTTISNGAAFNLSGTTAKTQVINITGSIVNNGTLNLISTNHVANLTFTGATNTSFTANGTNTTINTLTVNKGTSQTPVLTLDGTGNVTAAISGWLVLQRGTINFNNTGTPSFTLINGVANYTIPDVARLKVQAGTVNVIGNVTSDDADLLLAGALEVAGGTVNVNALVNNRNYNNDIEYAATGLPSIIVSGGSLYVNGAIRRPTTTLTGSLVYNQSGGTVTVGGRNCAANNSRGVFEIENNAGSSFSLTNNGVLTVSRSTNTSPIVPAYADIYLNPVASNVAATGTIQMGMTSNTSASSVMYANIVPTIGNFTVLNASTAQNVQLISSDLSTGGALTLNTNTTLTTNALNVNVGGDFTINNGSTYAGANSTTTFNGATAQAASLIGTATFLNITVNKASGSTLSLTGNSPTVTNLNLLSGGFDVGTGLNMIVNGDIVNYGTQTGGGWITISGLSLLHSITSTNGAFTNLALGGSALTKRVTVTGDLIINGTLDFTTSGTSRYLFIQSNKLTFSVNGTTSNAGALRFIRTNGVSSDAGVRKDWPVGTNTFTYAVGTRTNYTPVIFTNLNVSNAGSLTVTAVDNQHPTSTAIGPFILNYYWIVARDNGIVYATNSGASHTYQFPSGLLGGAGGSLYGAHLNLATLNGWNPGGVVNVAATSTLTFTDVFQTNLPLANEVFHYTVGTSVTLPNPVTPVYSRFSESNGTLATLVGDLTSGATWNSLSSWTLSPDGLGQQLQQAPVGRPVVILPNARVNMDFAGLRAFSTRIEGLLVTNTAGHDLGVISGTGTLRSTNSTLPAGNYTAFVAAGGGTIEYVAPMVMNSRSVYNNLSVLSTSSGTVTMTNTDLVLNGNLTIPAGVTIDNSTNNRNIAIAGNWANAGTFNAGTGAVTFNGTGTQNLSASTFNDLIVSNSGNVAVTGPVVVNSDFTMNNGTLTTTSAALTVNGSLNMNNGNVITSAANKLILGTAATMTGGSASSFVSGPMRKSMAAGSSFNYPVGSISASRYRPVVLSATSIAENWDVEYVPTDPTNDGYTSTDINLTNLAKVSMFEYWNVTRVTPASTASASVTLSYDAGSYFGSDIGDVSQLRVAHWNSPQWDIASGGGTFSQAGTVVAGTVTASIVTTFSPFTLGSTQSSSPLPITLISFTAERSGNSVVLNWKTAQEINNDRFEIERSSDGRIFARIATVDGAGNSNSEKSYWLTDKEYPSGVLYYRIKQVDFDDKSSYSNVVKVVAAEGVVSSWVAFPNPVDDTQLLQLVKNDVNDTATIDVMVQSSEGRVIMKNSGTLKEINARIANELTPQAAGIYILHVFDNGAHQIIKVIKR